MTQNLGDLDGNPSLYCFVEGNTRASGKYEIPASKSCLVQDLNKILDEIPSTPSETNGESVGFNDTAFYIYTSGTTGIE